jgi:hypothetical protein
VHNLGVVALSAVFGKTRYEFTVSTVQAAILCLFNETDQLTIEQIQKFVLTFPPFASFGSHVLSFFSDSLA